MLPVTFHAKGQRCLSDQWLLISLNQSSTEPSEVRPENTLISVAQWSGKRETAEQQRLKHRWPGREQHLLLVKNNHHFT